MIGLRQDVAALSWEDRRLGLENIIPDELIQEVLRENGKQDRNCPRLPGLLLMRFVLGLGLFCSDCYRQVFRQVRQALVSEIGQETLPPRRNRSNPRVIKRKYKKWKVKRLKHHNPPQPTKAFRESVTILR